MRPPKIDFRFYSTLQKHIKKNLFNATLQEKYPKFWSNVENTLRWDSKGYENP